MSQLRKKPKIDEKMAKTGFRQTQVLLFLCDSECNCSRDPQCSLKFYRCIIMM